MHYTSLQPLLEPRSVAVLGASGRAGRPGYDTIAAAAMLGWKGTIYPVTPRYTEIEGWQCVPRIADIPEPVDLAIIASSALRLESDVEAALAASARALLVYANPRVMAEDDGLGERLAAMAREAGASLLGPNTIGYVNYCRGTVGTWVPPVAQEHAGNVAAIIQSGSIYSSTTLTDPRIRYSVTMHPGQESDITLSRLIDYALGLPETRVLALYIEVVRDPELFAGVLEKASRKNVPVVALKPGRSAAAQSAIATHAGRLAGGDSAIDAVFRKHHVLRVESMDEWWTTVCLMSSQPQTGPGGLAAIMDSGGQRAMLIDEAEQLGIPLAKFGEVTCKSLRRRLQPDLLAENPVDYWGGEEDVTEHVYGCLKDALNDPDTAIALAFAEYGVVETDAFTNKVAQGVLKAADTHKPVAAANYSARQFSPGRILSLTEAGIPVLDGAATALRAVRHAFRFRDRVREPYVQLQAITEVRNSLQSLVELAFGGGEVEALRLVEAAGITTVESRFATSEQTVIEACAALEFPVVLKTAEGHAHKADVGGVVTGLKDRDQVLHAYREMSSRLGKRVTVQTMAAAGVEVALGIVNDPDYGPLVMAASGGALVELFDDKVFVLAPVSAREAREMVEQLKCVTLLDGYRGGAAVDRAALEAAIVSLSALAVAFADRIAAVDINPLIVTDAGVAAVDALLEFK